MSNVYPVTDLLANELLAEFSTNNSLIATAARTYESDFETNEYEKGDTIRIRRQNQFEVGEGSTVVIQDELNPVETITIQKQFNVALRYTSKDLTLFVNNGTGPFMERTIRPAAKEMIFKFESFIAGLAETSLYYTEGNAAAPINTYGAVENVYAKMQELNIQVMDDAYMALAPRQSSQLKTALQNSFNPILNQDISFGSRLGHLSQFDIFSNQAIRRHTNGSWVGTPVVSVTVPNGASSISIGGFTPLATNVIFAGDVFNIDGVNAVSRIGRLDTNQLMDWVVQPDVNGNTFYNADALGVIVVQVQPAVVYDLANPTRVINVPVTAGLPVSVNGGGGETYTLNLAYGNRGLDIVIPPMAILPAIESSVVRDDQNNVSLRVNRFSDGMNDLAVIRLDMLCGAKWHPQYGIRVPSV